MEHGLSRDDAEFLYKMVDQTSALDLHFAMFIPTLLGQGTKDQVMCGVVCWLFIEKCGCLSRTLVIVAFSTTRHKLIVALIFLVRGWTPVLLLLLDDAARFSSG